MNNCSNISELVMPWAASSATRRSCGRECRTLRRGGRDRSSAGGGQFQSRSLSENGRAHPGERAQGGAELFARVPAALAPAQPLVVEELGAGRLGSQRGRIKQMQRVLVVRACLGRPAQGNRPVPCEHAQSVPAVVARTVSSSRASPAAAWSPVRLAASIRSGRILLPCPGASSCATLFACASAAA
jgi:hypothetical protein